MIEDSFCNDLFMASCDRLRGRLRSLSFLRFPWAFPENRGLLELPWAFPRALRQAQGPAAGSVLRRARLVSLGSARPAFRPSIGLEVLPEGVRRFGLWCVAGNQGGAGFFVC
jgi:hypothetical protein